jgi:hypothetical protein
MTTKEDDAWKGMTHLRDFPLTSFAEATAVKPSSSNSNLYIADIKRDWCIGLGFYPSIAAPSNTPHPIKLTPRSPPRRLPRLLTHSHSISVLQRPTFRTRPTRSHKPPHRIPLPDLPRPRLHPDHTPKTWLSILQHPHTAPTTRCQNLQRQDLHRSPHHPRKPN